MQFNEFDLDGRLQRNLQAMGFEEPTPIQSETIPYALEGHDILGSAETGTGKTAAYLLPLLQRLLGSTGGHHPRALIVVPTRELALQVTDHALQLGRDLPVRLATVYGGVGYREQDQALKRGADVVVATPGRLLDQVSRRHVDLASVEVLVLDEGDRMLDYGFLPDIRRIVRLLPEERQTMLFSATLQPIVSLAREVTRDAIRVEVEEDVTPDGITQALYPVPEHLKFELLRRLLADPRLDSVLVFTRTKQRADMLVSELRRARISAAVMHGERSQSERVSALEAFRRGRKRVLVATDIAARGLDVEGIALVVNYDVPMHPEDYVHRIGRTGRMDAAGKAFTLVAPGDSRMVHRIEYVLGKKLERRWVEGMDYSVPAVRMPTPEEIRRYVEANRRRPSTAPGA